MTRDPLQTAGEMVFAGLRRTAWGLFVPEQEVWIWTALTTAARVLTVEDDPIVRADLRLLLEDAGSTSARMLETESKR